MKHITYNVKQQDALNGHPYVEPRRLCDGKQDPEGLSSIVAKVATYAELKADYCPACAARLS